MWNWIKRFLRIDFEDQAIREIKEDESKAASKSNYDHHAFRGSLMIPIYLAIDTWDYFAAKDILNVPKLSKPMVMMDYG